MIDLRSDNASKPTEAMRRSMASAPVGDEELGEDPSVRRLEEEGAGLLGKAAALFLPSGTMCNIVSYFLVCAPDKGILVHERSHPVYSGYVEPRLARGRLCPLPGPSGFPSAESIAEAADREARPGLLSLENTHNRGGGTVWPLEQLRAACAAARSRTLGTHLDGARLPNAAAASGLPMADFAADFDSVWFDLSKGLGCPSGAVLGGSESFIEEARRAKYLFGGVMHKAGILAAAGLHAVRHHLARLPEDHERARELARGLADIPGVTVRNPAVETNIVYFETDLEGGAAELVSGLRDLDVGMKATSDRTVRAVTHLDVRDEHVSLAVQAVRSLMSRASRRAPSSTSSAEG